MSILLSLNPYFVLGYCLFFIIIGLILSEITDKKSESLKKLLFIFIVVPAILGTLFLLLSTIYLNQISVTKGPIHYHADFEIYNCGEKVELVKPSGWSNRIGTPLLHEHGDSRIHIEGTVQNSRQISLGEFFKVIGGDLTSSHLIIPTKNGLLSMMNLAGCFGENAKLQVFVYQTQGNKFTQQKLPNPSSYVISPQINVPPGDCIIIEMDKLKRETNRLCNSYKVKLQKGELYAY